LNETRPSPFNLSLLHCLLWSRRRRLSFKCRLLRHHLLLHPRLRRVLSVDSAGSAMLRADDCRQSGDLEKALRECKKIIKKSELNGPPLAAYYNRCAEIELQLGKYSDAADDMENAVRYDPGNRAFEANLALAKARAGR
jgi:tetratricopeptide (TPR) repeat protein